MGLRIKEVCKEHKITLAEVAKQIRWKDKNGEHIGITPITLSQSLNGNPTLERLTEVADILGVDVSELFEHPKQTDIHGCIYIDGEAHLVRSKEDIENLLDSISE